MCWVPIPERKKCSRSEGKYSCVTVQHPESLQTLFFLLKPHYIPFKHQTRNKWWRSNAARKIYLQPLGQNFLRWRNLYSLCTWWCDKIYVSSQRLANPSFKLIVNLGGSSQKILLTTRHSTWNVLLQIIHCHALRFDSIQTGELSISYKIKYLQKGKIARLAMNVNGTGLASVRTKWKAKVLIFDLP
jgi:hypothetical protein